jgi:hypothetical protein
MYYPGHLVNVLLFGCGLGRDVINENCILGDTRGAGAWGINADFIGTYSTYCLCHIHLADIQM